MELQRLAIPVGEIGSGREEHLRVQQGVAEFRGPDSQISRGRDLVAKLMKEMRRVLSGVRVTGIDLFGVWIGLDALPNTQSVDERIQRLAEIKADLDAAATAVVDLQTEAEATKLEVAELRRAAGEAAEDTDTAHRLRSLSEESLMRVIARATSRGRVRGMVEGLIVGFIAGIASGLFVWFVTQ